jgi:hypothetical protein
VTGIHKIAMSVKMLGTALPINEALRLMQVPSIAEPNQAFLIGLHWKMLTQLIAMTQPIVTNPKMYAPIRKFFVGKIRMYIRSSESFTSPTPVQ